VEPITSPLQHILALLERIDQKIRLQVWRARRLQQGDERFQGLYIGDDEVDALLGTPAGLPRWATVEDDMTPADILELDARHAEQIAGRVAEGEQLGAQLPLCRLARLFDLSAREVEILLICLAPEIDLRYERLFSYLQDDVTRKRPSVDLILNLLSQTLEEKIANRTCFGPTAALIREQLLVLFDDTAQPQPPLLAKYLRVDQRIVDYLLAPSPAGASQAASSPTAKTSGAPAVDERLAAFAHCRAAAGDLDALALPPNSAQQFRQLLARTAGPNQPALIYLQGGYGTGKYTTAGAIAARQGQRLLSIQLPALLAIHGGDLPTFTAILHLLMRETLLLDAIACWEGFDTLLADEHALLRETFFQEICRSRGTVLLAGSSPWEPTGVLREASFLRIDLPLPQRDARRRLWATALAAGRLDAAAQAELDALADRFRLSPGQIADAAATARNLAGRRTGPAAPISVEDLYAACRLHSSSKLAELAHKVASPYTWDDIVLPPDRTEILQEIVGQVRYRGTVLEQWGFGDKLALGRGVNVLFAGPSGTGKTMAAGIMANALGLDIYKIDLSSVVSKYIGETEKNLARIFAEAESSNAILFFDEADSLFGRRSEVRDSHDRYANIETSYLLQRMEEYDGMAILATNLQANMDEAFVRRIQFTVEFPFPDAVQRRRIWAKMWPPRVPLDAALDLDFMARKFQLAGGNIRNIAVAAAYLAAGNGQVVKMEHLVRATQREYQKMGKLMLGDEFGQYAALARQT